MSDEVDGRERTRISPSRIREDQKFSHEGAGTKSKAYELVQRKDIIFNAVRKGMSLALAAAAAGVTELTIRNWARENETFALDLAEAKATRIGQLLSNMNSLADNANSEAVQLKANQWLLKVMSPEDFGDKAGEKIEDDGDDRDYRYL